MEFRTMDIKLYSAKKLKDVNLFKKMAVYAVVSISGGDITSEQKTRTPTDEDGGVNPTWNFPPMKFKVDEAALQQNRLTLDFKLLCEQSSGEDKVVGEVRVPIKELVGPSSTNFDQLFSRRVVKPKGGAQGELNFSCNFSAPDESALKELGTAVASSGIQIGAAVASSGMQFLKGFRSRVKQAWEKDLPKKKKEELAKKRNYVATQLPHPQLKKNKTPPTPKPKPKPKPTH